MSSPRPRGHLTTTAAPMLLTLLATLVVGCGGPTDDPPTPTVSPTVSEEPTSTGSASPDGLVDEAGLLTESAVTEVAPGWVGSRFLGEIQAPAGYEYGGDCEDSAWDVLYLTEKLFGHARTFQAAGGGHPAPSMTIAVVGLGESERAQDLDSLDHQLTSCVGEGPAGAVLQEPAPEIEGWSGLHVVAEDRDVYWAEYDSGIVAVQLEPGEAALSGSLAEQVRAVMALQLEQLG